MTSFTESVVESAALAWLDSPYAHGTGEALRFANEARGAGRPVPAAVRARLMRAFRPLADTVRDTLRWDRERPADFPLRPGPLSAARERELLAAWRAQV